MKYGTACRWLTALAALAGVSCVPPRHPPHATATSRAKSQLSRPAGEPFACHGRSPDVADVTQPGFGVRGVVPQPGALRVVRTDRPAPADPGAADPAGPAPPPPQVKTLPALETVVLDVTAENVPLGSLAVHLGHAVPVSVIVESTLLAQPVSMSLQRATVGQLLEALRDDYRVVATFADGVLYFESEQRSAWLRGRPPAEERPNWPRGRPDMDLPPGRNATRAVIITRWLRAPQGVLPAELAQAYCLQMASPRGVATVVGEHVLISDYPSFLQGARDLLDQLPPGSAPQLRP